MASGDLRTTLGGIRAAEKGTPDPPSISLRLSTCSNLTARTFGASRFEVRKATLASLLRRAFLPCQHHQRRAPKDHLADVEPICRDRLPSIALFESRELNSAHISSLTGPRESVAQHQHRTRAPQQVPYFRHTCTDIIEPQSRLRSPRWLMAAPNCFESAATMRIPNPRLL